MKYDEPGLYQLIYKATDECGNVGYGTRNVTVEEPETFRTVLYTDGTLIVNESSFNKAENIELHGVEIAEYPPLDENNDYVFANRDAQLWANERTQIKTVSFGSSVKPTSIAFWFQESGLESINWNNFDGSEVTSIRAFAALTNITEFTPPAMPNVKNMKYVCNKCNNLTSADFSQINATDVSDMTDMFQGCYALIEVDFTGISGVVGVCDRTFANVNGDGKGDMKIVTVYATTDIDFSQATSSGNMFRTCTSIVGGQGTTFDSSKTNKEYARIDNPLDSMPGYFTLK